MKKVLVIRSSADAHDGIVDTLRQYSKGYFRVVFVGQYRELIMEVSRFKVRKIRNIINLAKELGLDVEVVEES